MHRSSRQQSYTGYLQLPRHNRHMSGATEWVFSTALIQMRVPDRLLGRIFAIEYVAMMLATSLSAFIVGVLHDAGIGVRALAVGCAGAFAIASAPLWVLWHAREQRGREPGEIEPSIAGQ